MADGLNKCMFLGNLGADPDLRRTPGGQAVLKLRLACTESYLDRDQQRKERTEWVRITIWGKRAEALGKILQKGDRVFIEGRLQTSSYEKNGEKRYSTDIVATNVILNGGRRRGEGTESHGGSRRPAQDPADEHVDRGGGPGHDDPGMDDIPF